MYWTAKSIRNIEPTSWIIKGAKIYGKPETYNIHIEVNQMMAFACDGETDTFVEVRKEMLDFWRHVCNTLHKTNISGLENASFSRGVL